MNVRVGLGIFCFPPFFAQAAFFRGDTAAFAGMPGRVRSGLHPADSGFFQNSKNILNKKCFTNWLKS